MKPNSEKVGGFSLMELLVVIAIAGILAALLVPALSSARSSARSVSCKNRLHQMELALLMYVHDNQNRYPYYLGPPGPSGGNATKGPPGLVYWSSKLFPYYPLNWTNSSFHCPGYKGMISGPYIPNAIERQGSYAYNAAGVRFGDHVPLHFGLGPFLHWKDSQGNYLPAVSANELSAPGEMLAICDSWLKAGQKGADDFGACSKLVASELAPRHSSCHMGRITTRFIATAMHRQQVPRFCLIPRSRLRYGTTTIRRNPNYGNCENSV
jgi:prepilin-type N-terminal cleavage/methylation domain-containing protein